jgi:hypothetical protein
MAQVEDEAVGFTRVLFECRQCNVHKLPPRTTTAGYLAEDFDKEAVQKVELIVKTWSYERAAVELRTDGTLFAMCPLDGKKSSDSVERSQGSSRYFALKVAR